MEEIWKDIKDFEGLYQVSSLGRVRSLDRIINHRKLKGKILSQAYNTGGYLFVNLHKNNLAKPKTVHRLIANAFIEKILKKRA